MSETKLFGLRDSAHHINSCPRHQVKSRHVQMGEDLIRCMNSKKTENSTKVGGWTCNLCTERHERKNGAACDSLLEARKYEVARYENLKASSILAEQRARVRLNAAEKKSESHRSRLRDLQTRIGSVFESEIFADLNTEVDGRISKVHKYILASRCVCT